VFDRLLESFRGGTLHSRFAVASGGASASVAGEGNAKPLTKLTAIEGSLSAATVAAIVVLSRDLLRFSQNAEQLVDDELSKAIRLATDAHVVPILSAGAQTITATASPRKDLADAVAAITAGADSVLFAITPPALHRRMAVMGDDVGGGAFPQLTMAGGSVGGMAALPCDALASSGDVLVIDAQSFVADADPLMFQAFREGAVEMVDDPSSAAASGSPAAPAAAQLVSLFQTNSTALRAERRIGVAKLRTGSIVVIAGAAAIWGLEGSPPA
jgi:hypothetical protein